MQIVIDIDEKEFEEIARHKWSSSALRALIITGKMLPKGHGRLIDADALLEQFRDGTEGYDCAAYTRYEIGNIIDLEDTIIEADKEGD